VNLSQTGYRLLGFFNVLIDLNEVFDERRELIQFGVVVAASGQSGIVDEDKIIQDTTNVQVIL
jgi:hypothetical protein